MGKRLNKERALFLIGAALFVWVMLKLALVWHEPDLKAGTPTVRAARLRTGDVGLERRLPVPPLAHFTGGGRNPFFAHAQAPRFYVRCTVRHTFGPTSVVSRYTFDCRMTPTPVAEVRFRLPAGLSIDDVHSDQIDPGRIHGRQGRTYVVPVKPVAIQRTFFRCRVTLLVRSPLALPTEWIAPVISCTGATPNVHSESGHLALVAPDPTLKLIPASEDPGQTKLTRLDERQWPKQFATRDTHAVYHFAKPEYELTVKIEGTVLADNGRMDDAPDDGKDAREPDDAGAADRGNRQRDGHDDDDDGNRAINGPGPREDDLPLKLAGILGIEEPEPQRRAILRHKKSGQYYHKRIGETIDGLRIARITDDAVVIEDLRRGRRFTLRGRFARQYEE